MKRIGYIDARRVRLVQDGVSKWAVHSWGVVMGGVAGSMSLYLAADYGAYLNSYAAGRVELCATTSVRIYIGGQGLNIAVPPTGLLISTSGRMQAGSFRLTGTGSMILGQHSDPVTPPTDEGSVWYNITQDKLQFRTAVGIETVTSA